MAITDTIRDIADLDERLSRPTRETVESLVRLPGDIMILGAGGKMGPSLSRMAKRASDEAGTLRAVIAVSRFSDAAVEEQLKLHRVETIQSDLLEPEQVNALPDAANIVFMAGMKFGSTANSALIWETNVKLPEIVCRRFPTSRIVAFSTGNVYPLAPVVGGGSVESDPPGPIGEYAMSCYGRERIFEYHSTNAGVPVAIIRLSYAVEMRYGVLVDIAGKVWRAEPIDLAMGNFCAIWQGDANAMAIQSLSFASSPPCFLNVTGPEMLSVRQIATRFGDVFGKPVLLTGLETGNALISNTQKAQGMFGYPTVTIEQVICWTADWIRRGGETLNKPTHFETTDGRF